jgi:DNA helicase IV
MIRRATDYVRGGRVVSPYRQILVDEFQDISAPRAELILALARSRADTVVFCVGDDWQSIYRFAGSDVRYTSEFERLVGVGTTTALDQTFRFNDQIGRVASEFVMRNPAQVRKNIASVVKVEQPAVSLIKTAEPVLALDAVLGRINGWAASRGVAYSVYVLARYRHELDLLKKVTAGGRSGRYAHLSAVKFSTVHGAKGLEADFVVVAGLGEGRHGFPADKPVDAFQEIFLPPRESFEFAEERRLFYVALTRARHRVFLLYDAVSHSPFIRELKGGGYPIVENDLFGPFVQPDLPVVRCPRCATGEVRPKSGDKGTYYACHRFPACRYRERGVGPAAVCSCGSGDYAVCSRRLRWRASGVHQVRGADGASVGAA